MSCLYVAVSQQCKDTYGANALKIGFSSRGPETRAKWLKQEGYGGFRDWRIVNCEWFRREHLSAKQLESLERGVFGCLANAGSKNPCPEADEIISAQMSDVIAAFQWVKRRVNSGDWDFNSEKQSRDSTLQ